MSQQQYLILCILLDSDNSSKNVRRKTCCCSWVEGVGGPQCHIGTAVRYPPPAPELGVQVFEGKSWRRSGGVGKECLGCFVFQVRCHCRVFHPSLCPAIFLNEIHGGHLAPLCLSSASAIAVVRSALSWPALNSRMFDDRRKLLQ